MSNVRIIPGWDAQASGLLASGLPSEPGCPPAVPSRICAITTCSAVLAKSRTVAESAKLLAADLSVVAVKKNASAKPLISTRNDNTITIADPDGERQIGEIFLGDIFDRFTEGAHLYVK